MPIPAEFHKRDADAARNFGGIHRHGPREAAHHTSPTRRGAEWHSNQTPKQVRPAGPDALWAEMSAAAPGAAAETFPSSLSHLREEPCPEKIILRLSLDFVRCND